MRGVPSMGVERLALSVPAVALVVALGMAADSGPVVALSALRSRLSATERLEASDGSTRSAAPAERREPRAESIEPAAKSRVLRICADPNNLPFSNDRGEGFENKLAELVARELGAKVEYTWWPQRRGFVRNTLRAGRCDVMPGVPASYELVLATRPYYRSTYVFVSRADRRLAPASFDDPVLKRLTIGITLVGDEGGNAPPAHALAKRGIVDNVRGYSIYGDYREANPPVAVMDAVAKGEVDIGIVWGPLAGWYAKRSRTPLVLTPVKPQIDVPFLPFVYDIAMGVRRDDPALRVELDDVLVRRRVEVARILKEFGVPIVAPPGARAAAPANPGN
jgi:mxaJ protein